ncbi:2,4-dihydroxyhept-2-ene-1,7-dioic acid aldolase [Paraburkholderia ginsengiterrae]|uniref:2,4-dihydroxyhept-2-ene-1,7-dioic acid aldolase n=1 Tax=Paraburkholderia ginsengiterrae TaxID=1462993 RepID=A0A1A9NA83_9BURK|nr:4-hydroxy-2-oxoheptanedioate aldolase [Paraburkholderia ginsengiterrae]OAJ62524.1 2,4-dihydroxyhept-2-ene-1,7-dioic acid aldolase [Paraburkholderia ginsengiterrae]OAJ62650.1 2,4-dihydroxyhept-2-ene-1,7-dioic acid aldolase [Paraburkholderia ginsengiterrae]
MSLPRNTFKHALSEGKPQFGLWAALADAYVTELLATAGFDWLLIDNEHAPNDVRSTLAQLQAVAAYATHPVVRPVRSDSALIKQFLDIGAQTLLLPMIDTAQQAADAVAATRYPPQGIRGVGSALARASRWNRIPDYLTTAADELCVLVQVETVQGMENLPAIAAVDGVDGVFFGPADLSASMGLLGKPGDARVREAIRGGIQTVRHAGKAAGVLAPDPAIAADYLDAGATFVAVGTDTSLLSRAAADLAASYKNTAGAAAAVKGGY